MQTVGECHTAIAHLKGIRLHGNKLTMEMSKGGRELPPIPPPGRFGCPFSVVGY